MPFYLLPRDHVRMRVSSHEMSAVTNDYAAAYGLQI